MSTKIEWADAVWNPTIGCTRVSAGCQNCYAERMANRLAQNPATPEYVGLAEKGRWTGKVKCLPERLDQPLRWRKPKRIFVNSMSDLFHEDVPCWMVDKVFATMALCPQHTFMVLTKRPDRMAAYMLSWSLIGIERMARELVSGDPHGKLVNPEQVAALVQRDDAPLPNVWLGVSVEDQVTADERIPWLLKTPAVVRFVSCEPLLGPVDLYRHSPGWLGSHACGISWLITGGETGPGARPAHPDWFRGLRDQCQAASVPFFFKRHGAGNDSRLLDGVEHNAYPEGDHA